MTSNSEAMADGPRQEYPDVRVSLRVFSEARTARDISTHIGLQPDESWNAGDRRTRANVIQDRSGWILYSGLPRVGVPVEKHLKRLLARVRPLADRLQILARDSEIAIICFVYTDHQLILDISPELIQEINSLGFGIGIETYYVPPGGSEGRGAVAEGRPPDQHR